MFTTCEATKLLMHTKKLTSETLGCRRALQMVKIPLFYFIVTSHFHLIYLPSGVLLELSKNWFGLLWI